MRILVLFIALTAWVFPAGSMRTASAHPLNNGYSNLTVAGNTVAYDLFIPENSLLRFDISRNNRLEQEELDKQQGEIEAYLNGHIRIETDGRAQQMRLLGMERNEQEAVPGILFHLHFTGADNIDSFTLNYELLFDDIDPDHTNFVLVQQGNDMDQALLQFYDRTYHFESLHPHIISALWKYFRLGIHHIVTGYDHVLFLLSLLLVATRARDVVKIVTAFTVAHSITLFLAATGTISVNPKWIEAAIALTICYVALENPFIKKINRRWALTFLFGLIHGMGFAGALAETGLPKKNLVGTLLSFNLGVETGQLAIVLLVLPLLLRLRKFTGYRKGMIAGSGVIFLIALYWLIERLLA